MELSKDVLSQFAKLTAPKKAEKKESVAYGTVRISNGKTYVRLDGSELETPVSQTVAVNENDRVVVTIKNHTAYVTGNLTAPSPNATLSGLKVAEMDQVFTSYLHSNYADIDLANINQACVGTAYIDCLNAYYASIGKAEIDVAEITKLAVGEAFVERLSADYADITFANVDTANIDEAFIEYLDASYMNVTQADIKYATIENLNALDAHVVNLEGDYGDFKTLVAYDFGSVNASINDIKAGYAQVDFANIGSAAIERIFSDYGMVKDLAIVDGHITGELSAVTINGDLINTNTLKADRLILKGSDGLYYNINVDAMGRTEADKNPANLSGINGSVIVADSITAGKIHVEDLEAFGATIGGFEISTHSLHSHSKSTITATAPGIFMDDSGQIYIGDSDDYIKYTKINDHDYKLEISAQAITIGTSKKNIETALTDIEAIAEGAVATGDGAIALVNDQGTAISDLSSDVEKSFESLQKGIKDNKDSISDANKAIDNVRDSLNSAQTELDKMTGFIDIDTQKATIELGDKESPFGVRITNTEIDFKIDRIDGSTDVPAYIGIDTSDSKSRLYVERGTFEEEISFGNFVFVKHTVDGKTNMGIIRRGGG